MNRYLSVKYFTCIHIHTTFLEHLLLLEKLYGPIVVCNVCTSVFSPVQAILSAFWTNCCRLGREASQQTTALHSTSPLNFCCQFTTLYFLATAPVLSNQTSPMLVVQFTFFRNAPTLKGKRNQAFISD